MKQNCVMTLVCVFLIVISLITVVIIIKNNQENYTMTEKQQQELDQYYNKNPIESRIVCKNTDSYGCQGFCRCNSYKNSI